MRRFLRPGFLIPVLGLLAGVLSPAAPAQAAVNLSINDVSQVETNAGSTVFSFTVTATNTDAANPSGVYSFSYRVNDGTAPPAAAIAGGGQPNNDYNDKSGTFANFGPLAPGASQPHVIDIEVNGDDTFELDDQFTVELENPLGAAVIVDGSGLGTIQNDDTVPTLSIADDAEDEGVTQNFTVTLSNPTYLAVTFDASTADGSATAAGAGVGNPDYNAFANAGFTIPAGSESTFVLVLVNDDGVREGTETFFVNLTDITNATEADDSGIGQINNNDDPPTLSFSPANSTLCENPSEQQLVTVSLSAPSGLLANFVLGVGGTAILNTDYTLELSGGGPLVNGSVITFQPGETQKTIIVTTLNDLEVEGNESLTLSAAGFLNLNGATNAATVNISDDESWSVSLLELPNPDPLFDPGVIGLNGHPVRCFRATVLDDCGNPVIGVRVTFTIDGNTGGRIVGQSFSIINQNEIEVVTNDAGQAEFCYIPQFPGVDEVVASVVDNSLNDVDSNTVLVDVDAPTNTANAAVTGGGYVDLAEVLVGLLPGPTGVPSFFSLDVRNGRNNRTAGTVNTTLGIALPLGPGGRWIGGTLNLRSVRMLALLAGQGSTGGKRAVAFGLARVQIQVQRRRFTLNNVLFRVDAEDHGTPGVPNDRFQLTVLVNGLGGIPGPFTLTFGGNLDFVRARGVRNDISVRTGVIVPLP